MSHHFRLHRCPVFPQRCSKPQASQQRGRAAGCNSSTGFHLGSGQSGRTCQAKCMHHAIIQLRRICIEASPLCVRFAPRQSSTGFHFPNSSNAFVAQLEEQVPSKHKVVGSSPTGSASFSPLNEELSTGQACRHRLLNVWSPQRGWGASPRSSATFPSKPT